MKPVFEAAAALGYTTSFLPEKYGGGGASIVDTLITTEELAAVDGGFPTIVLVNGLALMPLTWFGDEKLCERWIGRAVDRANTGFLGGWVVSERGGTANFDHPNPMAGIQLVARPDKSGDTLVLNGEKHWPCNAGGWDLRGADVNLCIVRTDLAKGGREALSAVLVERDTPGVDYQVIDKLGHRTCQNVTMTFRDVRVPAENLVARGDGDLVINRNFTWSGPIAGIAAVGVARGGLRVRAEMGEDVHRRRHGADHQPPGRRLPARRRRRADRGGPVHVLEGRALPGQPRQQRARAQRDEQGVLHRAHAARGRRLHAHRRRQRARPPVRASRSRYRESIVFPLYDAGNLAMQQRRAWGVMADPGYTPDLFVDSEPLGFTKSMEGFGLGEKR